MQPSGDFLLWSFLAPLAEEYRKALANSAFDKVKQKLAVPTEPTGWRDASLWKGASLAHLRPDLQEQIRTIVFMRGVLKSPLYAKDHLKSLTAELYDAVSKTHEQATIEPLPSATLEDLSTPEFYQKHIRGSHPVVIRGAFKKAGDYSFNNLMERFGSQQVRFLDMNGDVVWDEFRSMADKPLYLANSERLLSSNPELLSGLEPDTFTSALKLGPSYGTQIFIANRRTGTPAHAGYNFNMFYQLDGSKRWTIIDPAYACYYYPYIVPTHIDSATDWHTDADRERCPLFRYCPTYEVELQAGDILFNPYYWLHTVKNTSDRSVGASMRFTPEPGVDIADSSPMTTAIRQLAPHSLRNAHVLAFDTAMGKKIDIHDTLLPEGYRFSREEMCEGWGIEPAPGMSVVLPPPD